MNAAYERSILRAIQSHELFGEPDMARKLMKEYSDEKRKGVMKEDQVFEGILIAVGWDRLDHISQSSLYTQDDEDILLEHSLGMKKFTPFLNQKVRIWGDVTSNGREERRISVKRIARLFDGGTNPLLEIRDGFDNIIVPAA